MKNWYRSRLLFIALVCICAVPAFKYNLDLIYYAKNGWLALHSTITTVLSMYLLTFYFKNEPEGYAYRINYDSYTPLMDPPKLGSVWRSYEPYLGEGSRKIIKIIHPGKMLIEHFDCKKYPEMNGQKEEMYLEDLQDYYEEIK